MKVWIVLIWAAAGTSEPLWAIGPTTGLALLDDALTTAPRSAREIAGSPPSAPVAASAPQAFSIRAESSMEPRRQTYPSNRTFDYVIQVRWHGDLGAVNVLPPEPPTLENLECLKTSVANFTHPESGEASVEFRFALKPLKTGPARVGGASIPYSMGPHESKASLSVDGLDVDVGKPQRDWRRLGLYGAGGLAGAGALAAIVALVLGRVARREAPVPPPPSPFDELRGRIPGLDGHLIEGDFSAYYGALREILCKALALAGLFPARSPTAAEFEEWLSQRPDEEREANRDCSELLEQAERVRFAGWRPSADENRAARKQLEAALSRLETAALGPKDKEKEGS